jgi:hypothetical protein
VNGESDLTGRLRAWSHRRQRLGRAGADALHTLTDVIAVYSSHPTAPLSLAARCAGLDAPAFWALERTRQAVRVPAMRGSIHLVPARTAAETFAATRRSEATNRRLLREAGVDEREYARLAAGVLEHAAEPVALSDLQRVLGGTGRLSMVVRVMAYRGLVLRLATSLGSDVLRYVGTRAWLGHPLEADPVRSLGWLAERYLRGYGPARIADFAWWAGVPGGRAAAALGSMSTVDVGSGLLLPADERDAFAGADPLDPDALDALPKWDMYSMGYAPDGRGRFIDEAYLARTYAGPAGPGASSGDGLPLLLRAGRAVGTWSHRLAGGRLLVTWTPFQPGTPSRRLADAFAPVAALLGAAETVVGAG